MGRLALVFSFIAYAVGVTANNGCYYVTIDLSEETDVDLPSIQDFGFGLWSRQDNWDNHPFDTVIYYCVEYPQSDIDYFFDSKWKAARAMAILAGICGGVTFIICICLSCVSIQSKTFLHFTVFLSAAAGFFQSLTFIAFSSDICKEYGCSFGWCAGSAIAAMFLYWINAFILSRIPPYVGNEQEELYTPAAVPVTQDPPPGSVSVTQTVLPDGTKKTIRTTVNADRSKTVEETIEYPAAIPAADACRTRTATYLS